MRDALVKLCLSFPLERPNQLHLDRVAGLNSTEKMKVLYGIPRRMLHLHSLKIVHRDLKLTSIFVDSQNRPKIDNLWFAKHQRKDNLPRSYRLALTPHHTPEVLAGVEATFESDVFSYAILCYEVIECRQALIAGVKSLTTICQRVLKGDRPTWKLASPEHREIVECMWCHSLRDRHNFEEIVRLFENGRLWLSGTNAADVYEHKGCLDEVDQSRPSDPIIDKKWVTNASSLRTIEGELQRFGSDVVSTIVRCFSDVMQISDEMEPERLLISPFEEVKSIAPRRFDDYADRFLSDIPPQPRRSIFALTPLTAPIVHPADMNIDVSHCADA
jgi:serine/threonine protein kinase